MGYIVHGILQARILEWVAFPFSSGSSQPRHQTQVSHIAGRFSLPTEPWGTPMTNLDSKFKSGYITLPTKVHLVKAVVFLVVVYGYELDHKENWAPKNWCFWTVVLEKTLESPLDCKEITPVKSKGNQFWIFIGRPDAKAETPLLWPPAAKNWLFGRDPNLRKTKGRRRQGRQRRRCCVTGEKGARHNF